MAQRSSTAADYARRVLQAQQHLEDHLDDELRPAELARAASFSLHHFHRIFRAHLGETVMQHLRRLRLERAARAPPGRVGGAHARAKRERGVADRLVVHHRTR